VTVGEQERRGAPTPLFAGRDAVTRRHRSRERPTIDPRLIDDRVEPFSRAYATTKTCRPTDTLSASWIIQQAHPSLNHFSLIRWRNRARHTAIARAMRFEKTYYSPLVAATFGAGAVDVVLDEAVVLNGYPGGPFT
jgi:hypothetical protein